MWLSLFPPNNVFSSLLLHFCEHFFSFFPEIASSSLAPSITSNLLVAEKIYVILRWTPYHDTFLLNRPLSVLVFSQITNLRSLLTPPFLISFHLHTLNIPAGALRVFPSNRLTFSTFNWYPPLTVVGIPTFFPP